jgi:hypothetical protein
LFSSEKSLVKLLLFYSKGTHTSMALITVSKISDFVERFDSKGDV